MLLGCESVGPLFTGFLAFPILQHPNDLDFY